MIYDNFLIYGFEPLNMTVERIGPFQGPLKSFDFTDSNNEPCNFFMLMSENGRGKTTLLELMVALMGMLSTPGLQLIGSYGYEGLDNGEGRAQWDIRLRLNRGEKEEVVVLSLIGGNIGEETALKVWDSEDLEKVGATSWHRYGYRRRRSGAFDPIGLKDELVLDLVNTLHTYRGLPPKGFEDNPFTFPTLLYFSSYRDILPIREIERSISKPEDWGYQPVHSFTHEGDKWNKSLDNLLIWLKWLDDGRFDFAQSIINERVFKGSLKLLKSVRKDPPEAIISNEGQEHRLYQLSSGEKSLVQLFLRVGAHMTRNTILLIDEIEVHLHTKWQHRLLTQLKQLVKDHPGFTIICTTHSREVLKHFNYEMEEDKLRKGGMIIEGENNLGGEAE